MIEYKEHIDLENIYKYCLDHNKINHFEMEIDEFGRYCGFRVLSGYREDITGAKKTYVRATFIMNMVMPHLFGTYKIKRQELWVVN